MIFRARQQPLEEAERRHRDAQAAMAADPCRANALRLEFAVRDLLAARDAGRMVPMGKRHVDREAA